MAASGLLGTTRRGRPVYHVGHASYSGLENHKVFGAEPHVLGGLARQAHPHYTAADHAEAADFHYAKRNLQAGRAHDAAAQQMSKGLTMNKAGGEGSRGGKIIGHTKSGKPVYAATQSRHSGMQSHAKSGGHHVIEKNPEYSAQDHRGAAEIHNAAAEKINNKGMVAGRKGDISFGQYARHIDTAKAHNEAAANLESKNPSGVTTIRHGKAYPVMVRPNKTKLQHSLGAPAFSKSAGETLPLGITTSGLPIPPPWDSPLGYVYEGVGQELDVGQAAAALGAAGPSMAAQDHLDTAVAYHALAAALSQSSDARADASAKAAFMHFAAAGVDPMSVNFAPAVMGETRKALSKAKAGEGSRGGHIIGHSKTGRAIYAAHGPAANHDLQPSDHMAAASALSEQAAHAANIANQAGQSRRKKKQAKASLHLDLAHGNMKMAKLHADLADLKAKLAALKPPGSTRSAAHGSVANSGLGGAKKSPKSGHVTGIQEKTMSKSIVGYLASGEPVYAKALGPLAASDAAAVLQNFLQKSTRLPGTTYTGKKIPEASHDVAHLSSLSDQSFHGQSIAKKYKGWTSRDHAGVAHHFALKMNNAKGNGKHDLHVASAAHNAAAKIKQGLGKSTSSTRERIMSKSIVGYLASGEPVYSSMPAELVAKSDAVSVLTIYLSKAEKGEGSRGGKIIGHSASSGRPIYAKQGPGKHSSRLRMPVGKTNSGKEVHGLAENSNAPIANGILSHGANVDHEKAGRTVHRFNSKFTHKDHLDAAIAHKTQAAVFRGQAKRLAAKGGDAGKVAKIKKYSEMHDALAIGHSAASEMHGKGTGVARKSEKPEFAWASPSSYMGKYRAD